MKIAPGIGSWCTRTGVDAICTEQDLATLSAAQHLAALSETKEPQPDEWKQFKDMLSKKIFASANTVASFVAGGGLNRLRASRVQVSDPNPKETR